MQWVKNLTFSFLTFSMAVFATSDSDGIHTIAENTAFKNLAEITLLANTTIVYLTAVDKDSDQDGVNDYEDNCPNTPVGSVVWTAKKVREGAKPGQTITYSWVGCRGGGIETVENGEKLTVLPVRPYTSRCWLRFASSKKERRIKKGTALMRTSTEPKYFSEGEATTGLELKSAGGGIFNLYCKNPEWKGFPTLERIKAYFEFEFPEVDDVK